MSPTSGPAGDPLWSSDSTAPSGLAIDEAAEAPVEFGALDAPDDPVRRRRQRVALAALALLAALMAIVWALDDRGPTVRPVIPIDAWAPYWALDRSAEEIGRRDEAMREVSPFWFRADGVDQINVDPNASADLTAQFLDDADDVRVVPSIVDGLPAGGMAAIIADPATRSRHVDAIVEFADDGDYDGIDLNYEQFAFADGRDTWATTRPNWVLFVAELAERLHDDGRTLTASVPVVYDADRTSDSGYWVYDYAAIVEHVDIIRIMAYDFSVRNAGPIAPLSFVQRAIDGAIEATGRPDKLSLGLAMYGRNWPVSVTGECPEPGNTAGVTVPGVTTVTPRSVDDLIERRAAVPVYDDEIAEWSFEYQLEITDSINTCVQTREVHWVDAEGVRARMDLAIDAGLGGVALWGLGFDDDDVWDAILVDADSNEPDART